MVEQLRKIQKAAHVFQILTKIAYIFSIVGASLLAGRTADLRDRSRRGKKIAENGAQGTVFLCH